MYQTARGVVENDELNNSSKRTALQRTVAITLTPPQREGVLTAADPEEYVEEGIGAAIATVKRGSEPAGTKRRSLSPERVNPIGGRSEAS